MTKTPDIWPKPEGGYVSPAYPPLPVAAPQPSSRIEALPEPLRVALMANYERFMGLLRHPAMSDLLAFCERTRAAAINRAADMQRPREARDLDALMAETLGHFVSGLLLRQCYEDLQDRAIAEHMAAETQAAVEQGIITGADRGPGQPDRGAQKWHGGI